MMNIILIPAYQPDEKLSTLIQDLIENQFRHIIVVDDGSDENHQAIFSNIIKNNEVTLLKHTANQGKGAALKTGLAYCQQKNQGIFYSVITVDADGQHAVADIKKLSIAAEQAPRDFILGVRNFDHVPLRSKFGNTLTRWIFQKLYRKKLMDTQTGLRAIPAALIPFFLKIDSNCYEFETECLIQAVKMDIPIQQISIQTIYIDHNASSHFKPIRDSVKIYWVFFRFAVSALTSYIADLGIFVVLYYLGNTIFMSLLIARAASAVINFILNKYKVYQSTDGKKLKKEVVQYVILATLIFFVSYYLILLCNEYLPLPLVLDKILVDFALFFVNFFVQRAMVFKARETEARAPASDADRATTAQ